MHRRIATAESPAHKPVAAKTLKPETVRAMLLNTTDHRCETGK